MSITSTQEYNAVIKVHGHDFAECQHLVKDADGWKITSQTHTSFR